MTRGRPKIDRDLQEAERVLAIKERGLLACYDLTEMGRKIVEKHRAKVAVLRGKGLHPNTQRREP